MLLSDGTELPSGPDWFAELKMDGARGQLRVIGRSPSLRTRRGRRCDREFPEILASAAALPDVILDGEIVTLGADGAPDFSALRSRLVSRSGRPAVFYAFDIMWHNGIDLREYPLSRRRALLEMLPLTGSVALVETYPGAVSAVLDFAREHQLEGAVVKRGDSLYHSGRSMAWQKFKIRRPQRFWVTAWMPGRPGELDRYWVGRVVNGTLQPTGEVSYWLKAGQAAALRPILQAASLGVQGRNGLIPVAPVIAMTVESHGRTTGWLRDPIITAVEIEPSGP